VTPFYTALRRALHHESAPRYWAGRNVRGEDHGRAKLTQAQVDAIRAAEGVSQRALARRYGIAQATVSQIRAGLRW
jgi:hypothetical protein